MEYIVTGRGVQYSALGNGGTTGYTGRILRHYGGEEQARRDGDRETGGGSGNESVAGGTTTMEAGEGFDAERVGGVVTDIDLTGGGRYRAGGAFVRMEGSGDAVWDSSMATGCARGCGTGDGSPGMY